MTKPKKAKKQKQLRAVVDTNLFISGLFTEHGPTGTLQDLWVGGRFELAVSEKILKEVAATLNKSYIRDRLHLTADDRKQIIALIRAKAFIVTQDRYETDTITKDASDNKFLACALEAQADYVVSGDRHLLELKYFHGVQIIDVNTFVKLLTGK